MEAMNEGWMCLMGNGDAEIILINNLCIGINQMKLHL